MEEVHLVWYSEGASIIRNVAGVFTSESRAKNWADYNRKVRGASPVRWHETDNWSITVGESECEGNVYYYTIEIWPVQ